MRSHYLFESLFTTPGLEGAHEKGGVEGEVGRLRRNHLVPRSFAKHRTITALGHARALKNARGVSAETPVEVRPLARSTP